MPINGHLYIHYKSYFECSILFSAVENITVSELTHTTAVVQWGNPSTNYSVWLEVSVDDTFSYGNRTFTPVNVTNTTQYILDGLDPYRNYTIEMYLVGELGNGSRESKSFRTLGTGEHITYSYTYMKMHMRADLY